MNDNKKKGYWEASGGKKTEVVSAKDPQFHGHLEYWWMQRCFL
jgi:hypothetical protein